MSFTRSATGCYACKTKRKKCDETKPHCQRCQKSGIECPGYTYVQNPDKPNRKPRTLPAPRTVLGRSRVIILQGTLTENIELQYQSTLKENLIIPQAEHSALGTSVVAKFGTPLEDIGISNCLASSSSSGGPLQDSSVGLHTLHGFPTPAGNSTTTPMTSGQAIRSAASPKLGPPWDPFLQRPQARPITDLNESLIPDWPPDTGEQDDPIAYDKEIPGDVFSVICPQPVLDRTTENNALPFVLQAYLAWISRLALEPAKLMRIAQDFVFSHFEDGEQSRWIIGLLANVGSMVGSVELAEGKCNSMLFALQSMVRRRLGVTKSRSNSTNPEFIKALDSALETVLIHFYVSPISEAMLLRLEAAPIFRRLCPEPPDAPIDLLSLLGNPLGSLGRFAQMDITFSVVTDMPTMFRYEVTIPDIQPSNMSRPAPAIQGDGIVQWLHGIPNQLILLFAKMISMRADGSTPSPEAITSVEREIRGIQPFDGSSSERFLGIMRSVVQECWRQVAFVYLFMAVCGDSSGTPRVKETFRRFMRLLNGVKPGRLPDEFLALPLVIISPAAQQKRDREVIRQRILGLESFRPNTNVTYIIGDYWARVDDEARQVVWSDVGISRRNVLGV